MLATLLVWLYTSFLCYVYGFLFFKLLRPLGKGDFPAFPLIVVAGLVVLTTLASFFSLFFQTGLFLNLLLLAGAIGVILTRSIPLPRRRPVFLVPLGMLFLALLLVLENATHRPLNPDTNIYHAQAIHWIESFPAVPGLANLHGRLAYNSAWFVSNALFSLAFLGLGSFHLTAGALFVLVLMYFWGGFGEIARGACTPATLLKVLFFPLAFSLLGAEISSPGSDLPVSLLLWLIAVLWAEQIEQERPFHPLLIVVLAAFVVTVKLSAAPVLLLAAFFVGRQMLQPEKRLSVWMAACGALVIFPFLARNVILSGYLLYPFPAIDLFSLDWKTPFERANGDRMSIMAWARFPRQDAAQVLAAPLAEWFPKWFADQTLNRRLIFGAALFSPLAALSGLLLARRFWLGWLVFCIGAFFWFFSAPDVRFGYGFLIGTPLLALAPWFALVLKRTTFPATKVSAVLSLLVAAYLGLTLAASFEARTFISRLLLPASYDRVATQSCDLVNGKVFCAKAYNACSYEVFPCIPAVRPGVELRNPPSLRDGFRTKP